MVKRYTVIVPAYNEEENIYNNRTNAYPLIDELAKMITPEYEVIIIDDGSSDKTYEFLQRATKIYNFLKIVRHKKNLGKTAAILSGIDAAEGEYAIIFDADLQFAVLDIPRFFNELENSADMVVGRKRGPYDKRFISFCYNLASKLIFGLKFHDMNAMKAFKTRRFREMGVLRKDMHRYVCHIFCFKKYKIKELYVNINPRRYGTPKYKGIKLIFSGLGGLLILIKFYLKNYF